MVTICAARPSNVPAILRAASQAPASVLRSAPDSAPATPPAASPHTGHRSPDTSTPHHGAAASQPCDPCPEHTQYELGRVAADSELAAWMTAVPEGAESSWNVKPTQQIPVALTSKKDGSKRFETAHWSLVPPWSKELKLKYPTFNARSEGLSEKSTFKGPLKAQRCVIPVTGFYEWTGPKEKRTPHAIFGPAPIIPMAGLYSWWRDPAAPEGEGWVLTATILTRASAGVMAPLHDRMPVFMADELLHDWLDPEIVGDQLLVDAVSEASLPYSEQLREWQVAPLKGDGPALILPA